MSLHRRPLLALPALLGAAALRPARAADPFRVGFVYVSPIGDAGWTFQHELGRRAVRRRRDGRCRRLRGGGHFPAPVVSAASSSP